jgi:hypothetical protein
VQPPKEIDVVELWFKYEEIAMHFNNLLMQFRLQLLGGAGLLGTMASYLIGGKVSNVKQRHWLRFLVSLGLLVLVAAAASLDIFYYDRLLRGAVAAILDLEVKHPQLLMSHFIEANVGNGKYAIRWAYGAVLTSLAAFTIWSWRAWRSEVEREETRKRERRRRISSPAAGTYR